MPTSHTLTVVEDPDSPGELLLDLGHELCERLGWKVGDALVWTELDNGTWTLTRVDSAVTKP